MKPFLKWVGGKRALLNTLVYNLPDMKNIDTFIEPMVGGGVLTCWMLKNTKVKKIIINDINKDLMDCYELIKTNPTLLIKELKKLEKEFHTAVDDNVRKDIYYKIRSDFNSNINKPINFIFLNKTCFNGLFRVNNNGKFNAPMGNYDKPKICDEENILELNKYFQRLTIMSGSYKNILNHCNEKTFVYFDPPYRPLNKTSNFTSYNNDGFNDEKQKELKEFIDILTERKTKIMLSNSDPKNTNKDDNFFDDLYSNYKIQRVVAPRFINSNPNKRGSVFELLIKNY